MMGSFAYYHHRHLLSAASSPSASEPVNQALQYLCNITCSVNVEGYCPQECLTFCPRDCRHPILPPDPPPPPSHVSSFLDSAAKSHHLSPFLIVTIVSLAAAFLLILCYSLYARWYRQRNRGINRLPPPRSPSRDEMNVTHDDFLDPDQWPVLEHPIWYIRTVGLEASIINAIAACKYKKGEGLIEGTDCSVCLSEFEEDETLRLLPKCNHAFHMTCIDTWLRSHTNCPLCRAPIMNMAAANDPAPGPRGIGFSGSPAEIAVGGNDEGTSSNEEMQNVSESTTPGSEEESSEVDLEDGRKRSDHLSNEESDTQQQPMRRSVSVDSVSASKISLCVANFLRGGEAEMKSDCESAEENSKSADVVVQRVSEEKRVTRTMANSSSFIGKSLASSSSSRTRSLSSSGRFILSKYSRNRSSLLPL